MKSFKNILLILIFTFSTLFSYQPSSESANPFNKYLSTNTDVDLFSVVGTTSLNLVSLTSRGAVSLPVGLAYSSNVEINARSRNDVAPAGWVPSVENSSLSRSPASSVDAAPPVSETLSHSRTPAARRSPRVCPAPPASA